MSTSQVTALTALTALCFVRRQALLCILHYLPVCLAVPLPEMPFDCACYYVDACFRCRLIRGLIPLKSIWIMVQTWSLDLREGLKDSKLKAMADGQWQWQWQWQHNVGFTTKGPIRGKLLKCRPPLLSLQPITLSLAKKRDRRFRHDKGSFRSTCQLSLVSCQLSHLNT